MLKYSEQNAKTKNLRNVAALSPYLDGKRNIYSLDLLSGIACPGAKDCKSMAVVGADGRKTIKDGPATLFRCFSASQEVLLPALYNLRKSNLDQLQACGNDTLAMGCLLEEALPRNAGIVRIHVGGDMFSLAYLRAWHVMAAAYPKILFYFYTKSLHFLRVLFNEGLCKDLSKGIIRDNLLVTASYGGVFDRLIPELGIRTAMVVYDTNVTLPIDHNDSHAATPGGDFALLIHGTQPKGSKAGAALSILRGAKNG